MLVGELTLIEEVQVHNHRFELLLLEIVVDVVVKVAWVLELELWEVVVKDLLSQKDLVLLSVWCPQEILGDRFLEAGYHHHLTAVALSHPEENWIAGCLMHCEGL